MSRARTVWTALTHCVFSATTASRAARRDCPSKASLAASSTALASKAACALLGAAWKEEFVLGVAMPWQSLTAVLKEHYGPDLDVVALVFCGDCAKPNKKMQARGDLAMTKFGRKALGLGPISSWRRMS